MYLSLILSFLPALLLGPAHYHGLSRDVEVWQNAQIAVDNAAILLGEKDEASLQGLMRNESRLKGLHTAYHAALACSFWPSCAAKAEVLRRAILAMHALATTEFGIRWELASQVANRELARLRVRVSANTRSLIPPISKVSCRCGLPAKWDIDKEKLKTYLRVDHPGVIDVQVSAVESHGKWRYALSMP